MNEFWHPELRRVLNEIYAQYAEISTKLDQLDRKEDQDMSGLTDLNTQVTALQAAVTALTAEQTTFLTDVQAALANEDSDAAVEAASQLVADQVTAVAAVTSALQAGDPATPAPPAPAAG